MTREEFNNLNRGDIIRHLSSGQSAIVDANHGDRATAVCTFDITNPYEWNLLLKADYTKK